MYEQFFGLVDAPFRLTPDPRYLFLSRKHAEALAHLKLGLKETSGFVCITGDVGTGKTTLLRAFLQSLGKEISTAYIYNPAMSAQELLETIAAEFGIPPPAERTRKALVDGLNRHLLTQRQSGRVSVVVIDEAQALSIDVLEQLRLLSNLETATEKLLRMILVGQPQLRTLLTHRDLAQLNQRITLRWHMGPLSYRETVGYIRHRLQVASRGRRIRFFTLPAMYFVYRFSRGIPRLINMVAHRSMLAAFASDRRIVPSRCVLQAYREIGAVPLRPTNKRRQRAAWAVAGAAACLAVAAVGAERYGWWDDGGTPRDAGASAPLEPTVAAALAPDVFGPPAAETTPPPQPAGEPAVDAAATDEPAATPPPEAPPPAQEVASGPPPAADLPAPPAEAPAPPPMDAAPIPPDAAPTPPTEAAATPPADTAPPAATPSPPAADVVPANAPPPAPAAVASPPPEAATAPPTEPAPVPVAPEPAPDPAAGRSASLEERLAAIDPETSAHAAVQALLAAWRVRPLAPDESVDPKDLSPVAQRRQLDELRLDANTSMLRLLDLPAILELASPEAHGARYATVIRMYADRCELVVGEGKMTVPTSLLERFWVGDAHVFWRDFESLGRTFGMEARGPQVARLQRLLRRVGAYEGDETGLFDPETTSALLDFQRSRSLDVDGRVGRLTRIVLYAAVGGYPRPTLAVHDRAPS
jgi:general secretion pathway protein A